MTLHVGAFLPEHRATYQLGTNQSTIIQVHLLKTPYLLTNQSPNGIFVRIKLARDND